MKAQRIENINKWCISTQINNRPNKTAKGLTYTNERRARKTNNSFLYAGFKSPKYKQTDICRTLAVKGTADKLSTSTATKLSIRRFKARKNKKA